MNIYLTFINNKINQKYELAVFSKVIQIKKVTKTEEKKNTPYILRLHK